MTLREDGGPAFPIPHQIIDANDPLFKFGGRGMSLRDYFAAMALCGIMGDPGMRPSDENEFAFMAMRMYQVADAMLKARAK